MMFMRKKEKGFTLIEVMLVVIIIGIIAIIALPKLLITRETAAEKSCRSNIQALRLAIEEYRWNDIGEAYPAVDETGVLDVLVGVLMAPVLADHGFEDPYLPVNSQVSNVCPGHGLLTYDAITGSLTCEDGIGDGHWPL